MSTPEFKSRYTNVRIVTIIIIIIIIIIVLLYKPN